MHSPKERYLNHPHISTTGNLTTMGPVMHAYFEALITRFNPSADMTVSVYILSRYAMRHPSSYASRCTLHCLMLTGFTRPCRIRHSRARTPLIHLPASFSCQYKQASQARVQARARVLFHPNDCPCFHHQSADSRSSRKLASRWPRIKSDIETMKYP